MCIRDSPDIARFLPACYKGDNNAVELESEGRVGGVGDAAEGVEWNGVDEARRTEISAFLSERFKKSQDAGVKVRKKKNTRSARAYDKISVRPYGGKQVLRPVLSYRLLCSTPQHPEPAEST